MITDRRQFVFFGAYNTTILTLDLPGRRPLLGESASNNNRLAVFFWLERLLSLILEVNCNFGDTTDVIKC